MRTFGIYMRCVKPIQEVSTASLRHWTKKRLRQQHCCVNSISSPFSSNTPTSVSSTTTTHRCKFALRQMPHWFFRPFPATHILVFCLSQQMATFTYHSKFMFPSHNCSYPPCLFLTHGTTIIAVLPPLSYVFPATNLSEGFENRNCEFL